MGQMLKGLAIYLCPIIGRVKKATFLDSSSIIQFSRLLHIQLKNYALEMIIFFTFNKIKIKLLAIRYLSSEYCMVAAVKAIDDTEGEVVGRQRPFKGFCPLRNTLILLTSLGTWWLWCSKVKGENPIHITDRRCDILLYIFEILFIVSKSCQHYHIGI